MQPIGSAFGFQFMCGTQGSCLVYVITVARARLQAGGVPFSFFLFFRWEAALWNAGVRAMSVCQPCFANMQACLHGGDAYILPRMNFALCCADVG